MKNKACPGCGSTLPISEFYDNGTATRQSRCKRCVKARRNALYATKASSFKELRDLIRQSEKHMNHQRYEALLESQTAIAKKVFEHVPINELFTFNDITRSLSKAGHNLEPDIVRGCLSSLVKDRLVKEPSRDTFIRAKVSNTESVIDKTEYFSKETAMAESLAGDFRPKKPTTLDDLALRALVLSEELAKFASEIDAARKEYEDARSSNDAEMEKLRKLRDALRESFGG